MRSFWLSSGYLMFIAEQRFELREVAERALEVDLVEVASGDVGPHWLEASMYEELAVDDPGGVAETVDGDELEPLGAGQVKDLEVEVLVLGVATAADDEEEVLVADRGVLRARHRWSHHGPVGRLLPVPLAVLVSAQAPQVV